ncbi:secondary thiamine-phosphate synthase enzyme YjbQ [Salinicoccus roseus]|uniref:secondary thiamine-phosphate synthase enzyme YjbQ n=1 Tax=Salinicoccus roseus TaxID=45670 RepID=UPI00293022D5|nr:secondary thiamine-phosphate synthase enzyme YjbQ [Salinicoccus roseus]
MRLYCFALPLFLWLNSNCSYISAYTTAGITINENADPDVTRDLVYGMNMTFDNKKEYRHAEGNSDSHMKSSLTGASETLIIDGGEVIYGTWQSTYFAEFDGPRDRKVHIKVIEG